MKIPEDLKMIYHDAKTFESSPSISNSSLVALIERITTLTEQLEETRNNLRQMTECRDDLNRLVAQREEEVAQARDEIAELRTLQIARRCNNDYSRQRQAVLSLRQRDS